MPRRLRSALHWSLAAALAAGSLGLGFLASPARADDTPAVDDSLVANTDVTTVEGEHVGTTKEVGKPDAAEEAEESAWAGFGKGLGEYGKSVGNRFLVGLNSLITFPADPVMDTVKPRDEFNKLPLAAGTKYIAGLGTGVLLGAYRAGMGVFDVLMAPLTPMKELSPEPRWMIFPGVEPEG
jgi:hypothetical protein